MVLCQYLNVNAQITYGAENEVIPQLNDTVKIFYASSQKIKSLKYRNSTLLTIVEFAENGNKSKVSVFPLNNLIYKTITKFNENGNISLIANYYKGIVTGAFAKYYPNGKLLESGAYNQMKKEGEWNYFNEKGNLLKHELYKDGKLIE